jgi:hypothetical protein
LPNNYLQIIFVVLKKDEVEKVWSILQIILILVDIFNILWLIFNELYIFSSMVYF